MKAFGLAPPHRRNRTTSAAGRDGQVATYDITPSDRRFMRPSSDRTLARVSE